MGYVSAMMPMASGKVAPPKSPCIARKAMSRGMLGESPQRIEPIRNPLMAITNSLRRLVRSPRRPYKRVVAVAAMVYAEKTQPYNVNPCRSAVMIGRALATMV